MKEVIINKDYLGLLKFKLDKENFEKLSCLENKNLMNFPGEWFIWKIDHVGEEISLLHKNARYTLRLKNLENVDENFIEEGN
ncbi:MAG: hypothetical protein KAJ79_03030 [Candidatus Omnitrophica bacterium]|nr:hypothetical protein [Candidatus Omnitrophota bacterium]